jgi:hypothetical protein
MKETYWEQLECGRFFLSRYGIQPTKGQIVAGREMDPIVRQYLLAHPKMNLTVMHSGRKVVTIQGIEFSLRFC